jgi:hypothetical protein
MNPLRMVTRQRSGQSPATGKEELLTLQQAAELFGKTTSNISYLIQYDRINKYNKEGATNGKAKNGELRVSRQELAEYFRRLEEHVARRMSKLSALDMELAFLEVPERERTKHVNRLHPYLGKFIPQLVEYFLSRYFKQGEVVVDPFCGSGTTLVQAAEMGINSVGIDISDFNTRIANVKLARYNPLLVEREVIDIMRRTVGFSERAFTGKFVPLIDEAAELTTESEYLNTWFAERSLKELLYYEKLIPEYTYQDLLRIILSRTARSCRLIYHYELATPSKPVREPYVCYKHKGRICTPVQTIIPRLKFYSTDTVRRLAEFSILRKDVDSLVIEGDSQTVSLQRELPKGWMKNHRIRGVFTSPPYVGQIDYHEQHQYAYELFGFERRDELEIGRKRKGKSVKAQRAYVEGISKVLVNMKRELPADAIYFIVANDKLSLYPEIFEIAGMKIEKQFNRPVEDRTERDKRPYSETVFLARLG